ncbi:uncharacterized protein F5Z01DRAFT_753507 [Emericellopsis atlantica]|uniref:Uncharacterized protein n=1 Tax=Emericellopsis atlantica TaxID=2614577 RepID=A0A9P8CKT1_9HYPO|nr:uncharacterized protein F5Z01DRAFT_753507 [Emericellopsis atlantica]KAG9250678.1 hypothetical protein F5Z01DRAFT_753507 [Emericellopsis atlantica]
MATPAARNLAEAERVALDKCQNFLGQAVVRSESLSFQGEPDAARCARHCPSSILNMHVPAIVGRPQLEATLSASGKSLDALYEVSEIVHLEFPPGYTLHCLRHKCSVWDTGTSCIVRLFSSDISLETRNHLERSLTSGDPHMKDGEYYHMIRMYSGALNRHGQTCLLDLEKRTQWLEELFQRKGKRRDGGSSSYDKLIQLTRNADWYPFFDMLQCTPALYAGLNLSLIGRMMSMELICRIKHLKAFWDRVLDNHSILKAKLDTFSLHKVQGTAPGAFEADKSNLRSLIRDGRVFGAYSQPERERIWNNLCDQTREQLVPSLWGIFEDVNYLHKVSRCMKLLVDFRDHSWQRALRNSFVAAEPDRDWVQVSDNICKAIRPQGLDRFQVAYRQLWLFLLREWEDLQPVSEKKCAGPGSTGPNPAKLIAFARLAHRLGFRSPDIERIIEQDPYVALATKFFHTIKLPGFQESANFARCAQEVARLCALAWVEEGGSVRTRHLSKGGDVEGRLIESLRVPKRSGNPWQHHHARDSTSTFLGILENPVSNSTGDVTSLFVRRSLYLSLFPTRLEPRLSACMALSEESIELNKNIFHGQQHLSSSLNEASMKVQDMEQIIDEQRRNEEAELFQSLQENDVAELRETLKLLEAKNAELERSETELSCTLSEEVTNREKADDQLQVLRMKLLETEGQLQAENERLKVAEDQAKAKAGVQDAKVKLDAENSGLRNDKAKTKLEAENSALRDGGAMLEAEHTELKEAKTKLEKRSDKILKELEYAAKILFEKGLQIRLIDLHVRSGDRQEGHVEMCDEDKFMRMCQQWQNANFNLTDEDKRIIDHTDFKNLKFPGEGRQIIYATKKRLGETQLALPAKRIAKGHYDEIL